MMNMSTTFVRRWLPAIALASILPCGCNRPATPPAGGGPASAPPGSGTTGAAGSLRIAVVPKGLAFDFWQAVKAGAEKAAVLNHW